MNRIEVGLQGEGVFTFDVAASSGWLPSAGGWSTSLLGWAGDRTVTLHATANRGEFLWGANVRRHRESGQFGGRGVNGLGRTRQLATVDALRNGSVGAP